jgi:ABC-2 family transporter protein
MTAPAIETAGLTKFYGETRGVEDLDLRVEHGEIFGYLGPNGAREDDDPLAARPDPTDARARVDRGIRRAGTECRGAEGDRVPSRRASTARRQHGNRLPVASWAATRTRGRQSDHAVAGEEEKGTLDFVLAHPVRRTSYVLQRSLSLVALVAALTVILLATVAVGSLLVDLEIGFGRMIAACVSVGLLASLFGMVALAGGAVRPGRAQAISLAAGLAVASWLLDGFGQSVDALEPFRPLSPWCSHPLFAAALFAPIALG